MFLCGPSLGIPLQKQWIHFKGFNWVAADPVRWGRAMRGQLQSGNGVSVVRTSCLHIWPWEVAIFQKCHQSSIVPPSCLLKQNGCHIPATGEMSISFPGRKDHFLFWRLHTESLPQAPFLLNVHLVGLYCEMKPWTLKLTLFLYSCNVFPKERLPPHSPPTPLSSWTVQCEYLPLAWIPATVFFHLSDLFVVDHELYKYYIYIYILYNL